jgi:GTP-binding protein
VERELELHDPGLAALPRVLALSKADLVPAEETRRAADEWRARLGPEVPVLLTSSATGEGLDELATELLRRVPPEAPPPPPAGGDGEMAEYRLFRPAQGRGFEVERMGEGSFRVSGPGVERLVARYDLENEEALAHLEGRLRGIGVVRALESMGFRPGDDVEIAGTVFELDPGAPS